MMGGWGVYICSEGVSGEDVRVNVRDEGGV